MGNLAVVHQGIGDPIKEVGFSRQSVRETLAFKARVVQFSLPHTKNTVSSSRKDPAKSTVPHEHPGVETEFFAFANPE